jgi:transposase
LSAIPTKLTPEQFAQYVEPYLSKAQRGYVCEIPLYKIFNYVLYILHTGCQWDELPIHLQLEQPDETEISPDAVYYHFRKWSRDGSLLRVWHASLHTIQDALDPSELNLDGSHAIAKKGGEKVAYQGRKKAKTSNILPLTDKNGYVLASTPIVAGNHNDAFNLQNNLIQLFNDLKALGIPYHGAYLNADSIFDTKAARRVCVNRRVIPNIPENPRNRKQVKRGRKRLFAPEVYKHRFGSERTFAWIDKFKRLLVRFERKADYFFGFHCIAFAMINLRNVLK